MLVVVDAGWWLVVVVVALALRAERKEKPFTPLLTILCSRSYITARRSRDFQVEYIEEERAGGAFV